MGLVKAAIGAASGVMADQWKEYFYCDALPADVLAVKGQKRTNGRSHGTGNVISDGSVIAVATGQCVLIVEQGKVVDLCAEPGEYTYNTGTQPSLLSGGLKNIDDVFAELGKRFSFGGQAATDQRVYYINTKELPGNKYGTPNPVPFRVVDQRAGIDLDIGIRCFGEYSYRIVNPILFYTNVCGNVENAYTREELDSQLKTELMTALQPAFARISEQGIRYSALPAHTLELADALNQALSAKWGTLRGIEIVSLGVSGVKASEEDEQMIKELQRSAAFLRRARHGLHGDEPGRCRRRHQCPGFVPDGRAAGRRPAPERPGLWLDLRLRPKRQHRKILHGLRQTQARSPHSMGVQLRRKEHRQVLLRMRQAETCRQVPQLRLCARRPGQPAQILPRVRQALRGLRGVCNTWLKRQRTTSARPVPARCTTTVPAASWSATTAAQRTR